MKHSAEFNMQKEWLSAYMDGEQVSSDLTKKLCQNAELQTSWANFHTIRAIMRQENAVLLNADFTAKVASLIEAEPTYSRSPVVEQPTVDEVKQSPFLRHLKLWLSPMTQVAVAAGVCFIAVLGVQTYSTHQGEKDVQSMPILQTSPFNHSVQEVSYTVPTQMALTPSQIDEKNRQMEAMLQHYELQRRLYGEGVTLQYHGK